MPLCNAKLIYLERRPALQSGAALVVGLILLLLISLMALANINSASFDLIATGNDQFHKRAFHAAEIGIERAMRQDVIFEDLNEALSVPLTPTGVGKDAYEYRIVRTTQQGTEPPPPGNSENKLAAQHFRITATGYSDRDSQFESVQELFLLVRAPDTIQYDSSACASGSSLDVAPSAC